MEKYTAAINDEKRKGKNILDQYSAGIASVMGHIALIESIREVQHIEMSNIENPGQNAQTRDKMIYNDNLRSARIKSEKEVKKVKVNKNKKLKKVKKSKK